jgi:beta-lactam-binding protein with PASTA domain
VPNVVGRTVEEGKRLLLQRELRTVVVDSRTSASTEDTPPAADTSATKRFVLRQGQAPDTEVRAGTEIRLFPTEDSTEVPEPEVNDRDTAASAN